MDINYKKSPTMRKFHDSDAFYRGVRGPVRSGKSVGMCFEIFIKANKQRATEGVRSTRFAVIRNTYRELEDTTLKTFDAWFGSERIGSFNAQKMTHTLNYKLPDDTTVNCEILFRALDRPQDVAKLLSLELTGAWINEAREVSKDIVDALGDRVGQYPSKEQGGCSWRGVMMDTNSPDDDHWWYKMSEEEKPRGWDFFHQPGALLEVEDDFILNPGAENIKNLNEGGSYYLDRVPGKNKDYIRVYYCNEYGFVQNGKPVHPDYVDSTHCREVSAVAGIPIIIGLDFGRTPAAIFSQQLPNGQWLWLDELVSENMGMTSFAPLLKRKINKDYNEFTFEIYGDPSGGFGGEVSEQTVFDILHAEDLDAQACYTNDPLIRREALGGCLRRLVDGQPGFLIDPKCKVSRKGLAGGFCYRRVQVSGGEIYRDKPDKNKYSHSVEAGEYAMVSGGEGDVVVGAHTKPIRMPGGNHRQNNQQQGWMGA